MDRSQGSSGQDTDHNKVSNLLEEINDESSMNMKSSCNFNTDRLASIERLNTTPKEEISI